MKLWFKAMDRHADERLVQDYCMGALYNISRAPQNMRLGRKACKAWPRSELTSAGGGKVVKEALARHPDAPTVRRVGQEPLISLHFSSISVFNAFKN